MLTIRLTRTGKRNAPSYRIVVAERRSKRDSKYTDLLGFYNPQTKPATFQIDQTKLVLWQSQGAQISDGLRKLLSSNNLTV